MTRLLAAALSLSVVAPSYVGRTFRSGAQDATALASNLDAIFAAPALARALVAVRIDSLTTGRTLYARDAGRLVMPASNMKLLVVAAAAERLGWSYRYVTTLEAAGSIDDGVLHGDLVVTGSGDPSIVSLDDGPAPVFLEWAAALRRTGIRRVEGRLVGDDRAFEGAPLGGGWSWDYLADGYAAGSTALNYNENAVRLAVSGGETSGAPADVSIAGPPGHGLEILNETTTGDGNSGISVRRLPGSSRLVVNGTVSTRRRVSRTVAVDDPTSFFLHALEQALASRGIAIARGVAAAGETGAMPDASGRRRITQRESPPLSVLAAHCLKASQNMYAETLLKTLGRGAERRGSIASGRRVVQDVLSAWDIPRDAYVIADASGLSRYDYVTTDALVTILTRMWRDERHRGPFAAALPVGARDGTLASRMRETVLDTNVQAKTGTIANVRALSGYLRTRAGEPLVFSVIVNHFTVPSADIDEIVERALVTLVEGRLSSVPRPSPRAPVTGLR